MGALMIMCPNTGQPISTGIETDDYSLKQIDDVPTRSARAALFAGSITHGGSARRGWPINVHNRCCNRRRAGS
jgi:hypothetical protein